MKNFNVLSLFSSAGIAEFGFNSNKYKILLANEIIPIRAKTHENWHQNCEMICGDVTQNKIKNAIINRAKELNINFVFATPPCQGVSLIGKNKTNEQMLKDKRNYLIFSVFDIVDKISPDVILIENVDRFFKIKYPFKEKYYSIEEICKIKYGSKYNIKCDVYDAQDYGVPQSRKRAFIRLYTNKYEWGEPKKEKRITLREAIGDLPSLESGEDSGIKNHKARRHTKSNIEWMKHTPTGSSATENEYFYPKNKNGERIKCYSASYKRMDWDKPAPTITMRNDCIASQSNVHPGRKKPDGTYSDARVLTLRELFILMSINPDLDIPEGVSDIQIRHMIGEAVPPKLVTAVLSALRSKK